MGVLEEMGIASRSSPWQLAASFNPEFSNER
jgi:hypothetical protein